MHGHVTQHTRGTRHLADLVEIGGQRGQVQQLHVVDGPGSVILLGDLVTGRTQQQE